MINDPKILKTPQKQESTKTRTQNSKTQAPMNIKTYKLNLRTKTTQKKKIPKPPEKNIRAKLTNTLKT